VNHHRGVLRDVIDQIERKIKNKPEHSGEYEEHLYLTGQDYNITGKFLHSYSIFILMTFFADKCMGIEILIKMTMTRLGDSYLVIDYAHFRWKNWLPFIVQVATAM
jgi:hypothetical protein